MKDERVVPGEVEQRVGARGTEHSVITHLADAWRVVASVGRVDQTLIAQRTLEPHARDGVQRVEEANLTDIS
jgi:hypothetical protein